MFDKLDSIDFEIIKQIDFQPPKIKEDFNSYFRVTEKIYGYFQDLRQYSELFIDVDKSKLSKDIASFVNIHKNIQNQSWKRPDSRIKKDFFDKDYENWLKTRIDLYSHFSSELQKKQLELEVEIKEISDNHVTEIQEKDESIEIIKGEKDELNKNIEAQKETIQQQKTEIEEKQLQIEDQELNKLAKSFGEEEVKYKSGNLFMIYFGFIILLIPTGITIYILVQDISDYVLSIPFGVLTIILWYFQYFQLKNYYINRDLETNFANRKAVANSFRGLLEMVNEEESFKANPDVKSKFFDKVSSILYSEVDTSYIKKHNDDVPISKLLDTVNELIKKVK